MCDDQSHTPDLEIMVQAIRARSALVPRAAILLGTGLGAVAEGIRVQTRIAQSEIPGMPVSTAEGHRGEILLGHLGQTPVVAFSGRLHCYEGYPAQAVVVPVRLARRLGAEVLIQGSAVGGLDPQYRRGEVVVVDDHINLMGVNPLVGPNDDRLGLRWPDMSQPYCRTLIAQAHAVALAKGHRLQQGVYVGVLGPNLETRAEYRMLRILGADVVGMSTVPETIAAVHCGLKVLALAVVTDLCLPDALEPARIEDIIAAAQTAEPLMAEVIAGVVG